MNKAQIYTFVSSLLDGLEMDTTLFNTLLDIAQSFWENRRPWVALRSEDESQTLSGGDTYASEKSLPSDFRKWYSRFPIVLANANGEPQRYLVEVPRNMRNANKNDGRKFYCDYGLRKLYICGTASQSYTIHQHYIKRGTKVSTNDATTWELDPNGEFSQILALSVAIYHKLGMDYDIINNSQADGNAALARQIYSSMEEWDAELAESGLNGQDYGTDRGGSGFGGDGMSGSISALGGW